MEREKVQTRDFWDQNPCGSTSSWEQSKQLRFNYTDVYLKKYINEKNLGGKSILEVGCGQGMDASEILKHCDAYFGIDLSERSLQVAKSEVNMNQRNPPPSLFINQDAENLGFREDTFDLVYSVGVLHHTPHFEEALLEISRVLKQNGLFLLMVYRSYTPLWLILQAVRFGLRIPIVGPRLKSKVIQRQREIIFSQPDTLSGTAMLELVGSPIINTYSIGDLQRHFSDKYQILDAHSYRVGIDQVISLTMSHSLYVENVIR